MGGLDSEWLVLGAGIVGLTAARHLQQAGYKVLLVAQELGQASQVPNPLLNPVRGKRGSVAPEALEALDALWSFYPRFTTVRPGILRPVPTADWPQWQTKLEGSGLEHEWLEQGLYLPKAAWLDSAPLLHALAHGLPWVRAKVMAIDSNANRLHLEDGRVLQAEALVCAGGAAGASLLNLGGRFTAGSVLLTQERFKQARSYGVYVAGNTLGGSYLPHQNHYAPHQTQAHEVQWLLAEAQKLLGYEPQYTSSWSGVRYRLNGQYLKSLGPNRWAITGMGSAGYFYAPLYAQRLLRETK